MHKAIESGKEHRKPYFGAKAYDRTCRNHGSCRQCEENRKHFDKKRREAADIDLAEYWGDDE